MANIRYFTSGESHGQALVGIIKDLLTMIFLIGVIFYMNWQLASMSMIFLPASIIPIVIFGRLHRMYSNKSQETMALISSILHETIVGLYCPRGCISLVYTS